MAFAAQDPCFRKVQLGALASYLPTLPVLVPVMILTELSDLSGHSQTAYRGRKRNSSKLTKILENCILRFFGTFMLMLWSGVGGPELKDDTLTNLNLQINRGH